jgi:glycosyltransferase involved in cell wall biosynthesis
MTLVTIITPTYNHEKYIRKCIDSVLNQAYKDWRMIIVEDGSTDKTFSIVKKYSEIDSRIHIIKHSSHWGIDKLANTYNQAIKHCHTKYIAFLEGDDFWPKDKLEKQINFIKRKNIVFSYGNCILTGENGLPVKLFTYNYATDLLNNHPKGSILRLFANLDFSVFMSTIIVRKKEFEDVGAFFKAQHYPFPDIPPFLKLTLVGKFSYQNEILGYYRKHENSAWFDFAGSSSAMGREELAKDINNFLNKNSNNNYISRILRDEHIFEKQKRFIQAKKARKFLSILVNKIAFKIKLNPLFLIFVIEYLMYKLKKMIDAIGRP